MDVVMAGAIRTGRVADDYLRWKGLSPPRYGVFPREQWTTGTVESEIYFLKNGSRSIEAVFR